MHTQIYYHHFLTKSIAKNDNLKICDKNLHIRRLFVRFHAERQRTASAFDNNKKSASGGGKLLTAQEKKPRKFGGGEQKKAARLPNQFRFFSLFMFRQSGTSHSAPWGVAPECASRRLIKKPPKARGRLRGFGGGRRATGVPENELAEFSGVRGLWWMRRTPALQSNG